MIDLTKKKILLTGGGGFLGGFALAKLLERGVPKENIIIPSSATDDLRKCEVCNRIVAGQNIIIHLAANTGGIQYNQEHPAELFFDNAVMGANLIDAAYRAGAEKFVMWGSVCAYPKNTPVPFMESEIWNGYPEDTNAPYGLAKRMMLVACQAYRKQYGFNAIYLLPLNMYGPGNTFNPKKSHVIPALIRRIDEAKQSGAGFIEVWGTGKATREFFYVEDAAESVVLATEKYDNQEPVNLGPGQEVSIKELVETICRIMDFKGEIRWDSSKPDGQPRRSLDVSLAKKEFGFQAKTSLEDGLRRTIAWYEQNKASLV